MNDQRREGRLLCKLSFKVKMPEDPDGCWLWTGRRMTTGYGVANYRRKNRPAHRLLYELLVGPVPKGLHLDHLCRVPLCVNPKHLEPVTSRENTLRGVGLSALNAKKTHCIHGHPLSGDNVFMWGNTRICRACHKVQNGKVYARRYSSAANGGLCYVTLKRRGVIKGPGGPGKRRSEGGA